MMKTPIRGVKNDDNISDTETEDNNGEITFSIDFGGNSGDGTSTSPAEVSNGDTLNMVISQTSSYTDSDGSVFTCEPKAEIKLFTSVDTIYVTDINQLTNIQENAEVTTSHSGTSPIRYTTDQKFSIGGQTVNFGLAYEVYNYTNLANETIEMPYVKVNEAEYGSAKTGDAMAKVAAEWVNAAKAKASVTITPLPQTRATVNDTTLYSVNAQFNLDIESVNTANDTTQTVVFSVNYVGAVVTSTEVPDPEPTLVKVNYRTGYEWEEPHDNMVLAHYAKVYRDRYYSNGEVLTDTFTDNGHPIAYTLDFNNEGGWTIYIDDEQYSDTVTASTLTSYRNENSSVIYRMRSLTLSKPELLTYIEEDGYYQTSVAGTWSDYRTGKSYDTSSFIVADTVTTDDNWESTTFATGWYYHDVRYWKRMTVEYNGGRSLGYYALNPGFYDQFLSLDGRLINFLEYVPEYNFDFTQETTSNGFINKFSCSWEFMGRDFYIAVIDTIKQRK